MHFYSVRFFSMRFVAARRLFLLLLCSLLAVPAQAQLTRERANPGAPVNDVFRAATLVLLPTVTNVPKENWNFTIQHSFGLVSSGVSELFGLDGTANVRFGLDVGLTNTLSIGVGRSRFDKVYDGRLKWSALRQTKDDRVPVGVAVAAGAGITTLKNGFPLGDRMNYHAALLVARKWNDAFSLQIAPIVSHFNVVYKDLDRFGAVVEERNTHMALGIGAGYALNPRVSVAVEYLPVLGSRSNGTHDNLSMSVDLDTGGHVFQLFFTSSDWLTLQHAVARNTTRFLDGDFRWGFIVNRVF